MDKLLNSLRNDAVEQVIGADAPNIGDNKTAELKLLFGETKFEGVKNVKKIEARTSN